ncbi:exodeoxyribonuclease III [Myceligenerans pegani]|uniref:Exodeoxyribonuclease III n=1 Tax=Myceligenerans pegani TaxID=2776917 RepID=A0ABR9MUI2_9MICO|nr:exodeoxyribonuclease III [Myceligenerans sp. TRM 65318]MBE1874432.1 exodeoxyribonuclease III [Myceligenerans sp. TRM 65318]MBE3016703.1 exodeoxyribonuclease III [Myceligenerans sp. TRM 65318]
MRIATWNVNSLRARIDRTLAVLERWDLDVLALQETKCRDDQFPLVAFAEAGYEVAHTGLNQWNGVAIASRVGLDDVATSFPGQPGFRKLTADTDPAPSADTLLDVAPPVEARAIGATCGGIRVWSLYVPHGRALGDPHYEYKLTWLEQLRVVARDWAVDPASQVALLGDWNVIPLDTDVYDVADFAGKTHVSPRERAAFDDFAQAGYTEVSREHVPTEHTYTYWDYQQLAFPRNKGLRIDFAWTTAAVAERVRGVHIDREERKGKGASDHVPVILELTD